MNRKTASILAGFLSAVVPGLGQFVSRQRYRGVAILLAIFFTLGMVVWYARPFWYIFPVLMWIWNIWDAVRLPIQSRGAPIGLPILLSMVAMLSIGWNAVGVDFSKADMNRAVAIMRPMLHPDFVQKRTESQQAWVEVNVPCLPDHVLPTENQVDGKKVSLDKYCAGVGDSLTVTASGFWPDADTNIWWEDPNGSIKMVAPGEGSMLVAKADSTGNVTATFKVPSTAIIAVPDVTVSPPHRIYLEQVRPLGGIELSYVGSRVLQGGLETIGMGLMATLLAIVFAIPISFLAARNLMAANPITYAIYFVVRTLLNIIRSIESLIVAIIFVVIVGLGPFAGVLALAIHSVAALAKLYSEVIEGIDSGPIEAVRSTGANWLQVVRYAVIPQVVPPFTAFTIYRWDINVRSATIIGFVGGGGIGFLLIELIRINNMQGVSALFITIAVIVIILDYVSAKIRERLV